MLKKRMVMPGLLSLGPKKHPFFASPHILMMEHPIKVQVKDSPASHHRPNAGENRYGWKGVHHHGLLRRQVQAAMGALIAPCDT